MDTRVECEMRHEDLPMRDNLQTVETIQRPKRVLKEKDISLLEQQMLYLHSKKNYVKLYKQIQKEGFNEKNKELQHPTQVGLISTPVETQIVFDNLCPNIAPSQPQTGSPTKKQKTEVNSGRKYDPKPLTTRKPTKKEKKGAHTNRMVKAKNSADATTVVKQLSRPKTANIPREIPENDSKVTRPRNKKRENRVHVKTSEETVSKSQDATPEMADKVVVNKKEKTKQKSPSPDRQPFKRVTENIWRVESDSEFTDDPPICTCDRNDACEIPCLNRALQIECSPETCPVGENCLNQRFQRNIYAKVIAKKCPDGRGWGLYADEKIPKDSFVIEYQGEVISRKEYVARIQEDAEHFYYLEMEKNKIIDAYSFGNESRFANHSCEPNCRLEKWIVGGRMRIGLFAKMIIQPGEEITYDYQYKPFGSYSKKCLCGARGCRGIIVAKNFASTTLMKGQTPRKKIQEKKEQTKKAALKRKEKDSSSKQEISSCAEGKKQKEKRKTKETKVLARKKTPAISSEAILLEDTKTAIINPQSKPKPQTKKMKEKLNKVTTKTPLKKPRIMKEMKDSNSEGTGLAQGWKHTFYPLIHEHPKYVYLKKGKAAPVVDSSTAVEMAHDKHMIQKQSIFLYRNLTGRLIQRKPMRRVRRSLSQIIEQTLYISE